VVTVVSWVHTLIHNLLHYYDALQVLHHNDAINCVLIMCELMKQQ